VPHLALPVDYRCQSTSHRTVEVFFAGAGLPMDSLDDRVSAGCTETVMVSSLNIHKPRRFSGSDFTVA
jgi:hypothetical protein